MENLIEVCAGPNCAVFADRIKAELNNLDGSFKIIKTACSKNCGNRFGPPVVRINGDIFQGEIVLQKLREIILSPQSFAASFDRKIHIAGNFQKISGRAGLAIDIGTTISALLKIKERFIY